MGCETELSKINTQLVFLFHGVAVTSLRHSPDICLHEMREVTEEDQSG
jgi:hypothetical protein